MITSDMSVISMAEGCRFCDSINRQYTFLKLLLSTNGAQAPEIFLGSLRAQLNYSGVIVEPRGVYPNKLFEPVLSLLDVRLACGSRQHFPNWAQYPPDKNRY